MLAVIVTAAVTDGAVDVDVDVDVDVGSCPGRITCNKATKGVPGGVICINILENQGVLVIRSRR